MSESPKPRLDGDNQLLKRAGLGAALGIVLAGTTLTSLACAGLVGYHVLSGTEQAEDKPLRVIPVSKKDAERQNRPRHPKSGKLGKGESEEGAATTPTAPAPSGETSPDMVLVPSTDLSVPENIPVALAEKIRARLNELDANDGIEGSQLGQYRLENGDPVTLDLYIGNPPVKIAPYAQVSDVASPAEYLSFLFDTIETPQDAAEFSSYRFVSFGESSLFPPNATEVLRRGQGDCDDWSVLTSSALQRLGQRKGVDYHPMILGEFPRGGNGHAVTIFFEGSMLYSIDQNGPKAVDSPSKASSKFPPVSQAKWVHEVVEGGRSYRMPVNGTTLKPDYGQTFYAFVVGETFSRDSFDFSSLRDGWDSYDRGDICFASDWFDLNCEARVQVSEGRLDQISYQKGPLAREHFTGGVLDTQQFRSGTVRVIEYSNGQKVNEIPF